MITNLENISLHITASIGFAMKVIDSGALKIAVVVDDENKLLGVVTDGDIRRALLRGCGLDDPIEDIVQRSPIICNIRETKEQILSKTLGKRIYQVPVIDDNHKFIGIYDIDNLLKVGDKENKVVLMVGGLGTRLMPLTQSTPKPMLKVGNKPILETIIDNFKQYGFKDFILSVNYKADIVKGYFGDGERFGVSIEYIHETKRMGTAGALSLMRDKFKQPFFVMNGDLLTNVNFEHFLSFHLDNDSMATMAVREYEYQIPYGVVNQDSGKITSIVEKPQEQYYVNAGIYMLNPDVLEHVPDDIFYDMPTLFDDLIQKGKEPMSFPVHEYWLDIGHIKELEKARDEYFNVFDE